MFPHLVVGGVELNSYGIAVVMGFVCAWRLLTLNMGRYRLESGIADKVILAVVVAGLLGSKLYHDLQSPSRVLADPRILISATGFAWAGGLLAGIASLFLLARHLSLNPLLLMDIAAPSAAIGYAVGRMGCLLAGDGDYGLPTSLPWGMSFPHGLVPTYQRVHPTPIYEAIVAGMICWYLWRRARSDKPAGSIVARYMILSGAARFLVEYIRINPRSLVGLTNAQAISALCAVAGITLLLWTEGFAELKPIAGSVRMSSAIGRKVT
jgi:phosphatidylglycerol:prolipoprotein diacylglycerol transferase